MWQVIQHRAVIQPCQSGCQKCLSELSKMILYSSDALTINTAFGIQWRFLDFMFFLYFHLWLQSESFLNFSIPRRLKIAAHIVHPPKLSYKINFCRMVWPSLLEENTAGTIWLGNYVWEGLNLQIKTWTMQARDSIPQIQ